MSTILYSYGRNNTPSKSVPSATVSKNPDVNPGKSMSNVPLYNDKLPLSNITNRSSNSVSSYSENAHDLAMKIFQGNSISGGTFNLHFNNIKQ